MAEIDNEIEEVVLSNVRSKICRRVLRKRAKTEEPPVSGEGGGGGGQVRGYIGN